MQTGEYLALRRLEDRYWWHAGLRRLALSALREHLLPSEPAVIADLGCGTGGTLAALQREFGPCVRHGADRHPVAVALADSRGAALLCRASVNALPYRDASFHAALALDLYYALEVDEYRALRESRRVLKEGGILIVNLPAFEFLSGAHDAAVHARQRYNAPELRRKLVEAGFDVLRLTYWNALLFPLLLGWRRLAQPVAQRPGPRSDLFALPYLVNGLLGLTLRFERWACAGVDLPFGTSLFAVARKSAPGVRPSP